MKVLITGATGFVAPYLARELFHSGHRIFLTSPSPFSIKLGSRVTQSHRCNLLNRNQISKLIRVIRPDSVVHLAGLSSGATTSEQSEQLIDVNVQSTRFLYQSLVGQKRKASFLFVSSGYVFSSEKNRSGRCTEDSLTCPSTPYGASKLAAEWVLKTAEHPSVKIYIARPFNHTGPGQSDSFVCPALAKRIIQAPLNGIIKVGNISSQRDFCDVRDVVRAYRLILEKRPLSSCFVLGSGRSISIEQVLKQLIKISVKNLTPVFDMSFKRKVDPLNFFSDPSRAKTELGWVCKIPFRETLRDLYSFELSKFSDTKSKRS